MMRRFLIPKTLVAVLLSLAPAYAHAQHGTFNRLERDVIEQRLRQFSKKDPERELRIRQLFDAAGCGDHLQEQPVKHEKLPNVICTLPGTTNSVIVIGAHFDHVDAGDGVVDNWSGAALLPSLFESLKDAPRQHTFVFVSFTDEERGLVGSTFYVKQLSSDEASKVEAMLDIDTLGLGPTKLWVSYSDPGLVKQFVAVASAMKLPVAGVNVEKVGDSDGHAFRSRKIPTVTIHSVTQETFGILHSSKDKLQAINLDNYYDTYKLIAGYLAVLDGSWPPPVPAK